MNKIIHRNKRNYNFKDSANKMKTKNKFKMIKYSMSLINLSRFKTK